MESKLFDKKRVILPEIKDEKLNTFIVRMNIDDEGNPTFPVMHLAEGIINAIPDYVFASYPVDEDNMVELLREASSSIYKIEEFRLMRDYLIDDDENALKELKKKHEDKYCRRGEFGELILHLLLREFKGTIPLVSKVYFKDSFGVPSHGFDAVHVDPIKKIIWLGESKVYTCPEKGILSLCEDLKSHLNEEYLTQQFTIIKKHAKYNNIEGRDEYIKILNDAGMLIDIIDTINVPVLCTYSDSEQYKFESIDSEKAKAHHYSRCHKLKDYFDENNVHGLTKKVNIILILFPVKDKKELIRTLHKKLNSMQGM